MRIDFHFHIHCMPGARVSENFNNKIFTIYSIIHVHVLLLTPYKNCLYEDFTAAVYIVSFCLPSGSVEHSE